MNRIGVAPGILLAAAWLLATASCAPPATLPPLGAPPPGPGASVWDATPSLSPDPAKPVPNELVSGPDVTPLLVSRKNNSDAESPPAVPLGTRLEQDDNVVRVPLVENTTPEPPGNTPSTTAPLLKRRSKKANTTGEDHGDRLGRLVSTEQDANTLALRPQRFPADDEDSTESSGITKRPRVRISVRRSRYNATAPPPEATTKDSAWVPMAVAASTTTTTQSSTTEADRNANSIKSRRNNEEMMEFSSVSPLQRSRLTTLRWRHTDGKDRTDPVTDSSTTEVSRLSLRSRETIATTTYRSPPVRRGSVRFGMTPPPPPTGESGAVTKPSVGPTLAPTQPPPPPPTPRPTIRTLGQLASASLSPTREEMEVPDTVSAWTLAAMKQVPIVTTTAANLAVNSSSTVSTNTILPLAAVPDVVMNSDRRLVNEKTHSLLSEAVVVTTAVPNVPAVLSSVNTTKSSPVRRPVAPGQEDLSGVPPTDLSPADLDPKAEMEEGGSEDDDEAEDDDATNAPNIHVVEPPNLVTNVEILSSAAPALETTTSFRFPSSSSDHWKPVMPTAGVAAPATPDSANRSSRDPGTATSELDYSSPAFTSTAATAPDVENFDPNSRFSSNAVEIPTGRPSWTKEEDAGVTSTASSVDGTSSSPMEDEYEGRDEDLNPVGVGSTILRPPTTEATNADREPLTNVPPVDVNEETSPDLPPDEVFSGVTATPEFTGTPPSVQTAKSTFEPAPSSKEPPVEVPSSTISSVSPTQASSQKAQTSTEEDATTSDGDVETSTPAYSGDEDDDVDDEDRVMEPVPAYLRLLLETTWSQFCQEVDNFRSAAASLISNGTTVVVHPSQVFLLNVNSMRCSENADESRSPETTTIDPTRNMIFVQMFVADSMHRYSRNLTEDFLRLWGCRGLEFPIRKVDLVLQPLSGSDGVGQGGGAGVIAAIAISCLAAVCLLLLAALLLIMRKRQKSLSYGQRCTPVSLDAYSLDSVSVCNSSSVRRKGARASKRSYGNPAFSDPAAPSHSLTFPALSNMSNDRNAMEAEFAAIPHVAPKADELPDGADTKNRYANVIPLPETRVTLSCKDGDPLSQYINANYVRGPKNVDKFYIACQAPLSSTVEDFWRMVWETQAKVILMLTDLVEDGVEKCADYLPPSEVTDCHRLFGDFQVTLKKREVKDKYVVSSIQLKNMETNLWREATHLWYIGWPSKGVPDDPSTIIAFLIEARAFMRNPSSSSSSGSSTSPHIVHCSPGTGRTGTVLAIDLCVREFETARQVDIPRTVYRLRKDRAGCVQTKEQYVFIYKVLNLYATKLTGGALDSI